MRRSNSILLFVLTAGALFLFSSGAKAARSEEIGEGMIGRYFTLGEVVVSDTAEAQNISEQFDPPAEIWERAAMLAFKILDPIREWLGNPVHVESWWRSPELTAALIANGEDTSPTTKHVRGDVADIYYLVDGVNRSGLIMRALLILNLPFDRVLIEDGTLDSPGHIHIEYDSNKSDSEQRRLVYRVDGGTKEKTLAWARDYYL